VLHLLVVAFERRLTFTVGFSVVRGRDNCIVWNGVHHKTNTSGGATHYGYPDATYFNRLKQELALKSVKLDEDPTIVA
jgi:deltex-like protein